MPKILSKINLPQYAAAPGSPAQGDMYYNTVDDTVYVYDGASWLDLAAGGGGSGDITAVVAGSGLTGGATSGSATLSLDTAFVSKVYYSATDPDIEITPNIGDIWVESDVDVASSAALVSVGSTTTGAAGSSAAVVNSGTSTNVILDFTIPAGPSATIAVGTVSTGAEGSSATVTNVGTSSAATFNFSIPVGATGATGPQGPAGPEGPTGPAVQITPNPKTASYTLASGDLYNMIEMNVATANTVTVGTALDSLVAGSQIHILQTGVGQTTIVASSVTVNATPGLKLRAQWSAATLVKRTAANVTPGIWVAFGDLTA